METEYDICIIGAGVAGGVLASCLGNKGYRIAIIEKNLAEQERMIGELLQPGGVLKLRELGLEHLLDGIDAQPINGYGLFMNGESFKLSYPGSAGDIMQGRGLRNGKLIQRIRHFAFSLPGVTAIEGTVTQLYETNGRVNGVKYTAKKSGEELMLKATLTLVCDGMFSQFREVLSSGPKKVSSYFMGMILKDCFLPYKNHGHVIITDSAPCLVYPISSDETRILIDFPGTEAPRKSVELISYLNTSILPQLPAQIQPSFAAAVRQGKFRVMPNHLVPAQPYKKHGVVMVGDSLNMRHPLTGGGMTVALTDIQLLVSKIEALPSFDNPAHIDGAIESFYAERHKHNATINILADALYGVMQNSVLRNACYYYLKSGGKRAQEPISILSAISRNRQLLLKHFFAVALYGVKTEFNHTKNQNPFKRSHILLKDAVDIVQPLVMNEKPDWAIKSALKVASAIL